MELATLEITEEEAKERLAEYEHQLAEERTAEDEAIKAGYRAAARGLPVVRLTRCIQNGGFFDNGLPRIAVVRADATECWVQVSHAWHGRPWSFIFGDEDRADNRGALVGKHTLRVSVPGPDQVTNAVYRANTIVPIIPPRHRPRRHRIRGFHILWEVEQWRRVAPKDPALLRHIRGDLWSVVATWDLTDLERAVLSARG
jgi:hypothetical protein